MNKSYLKRLTISYGVVIFSLITYDSKNTKYKVIMLSPDNCCFISLPCVGMLLLVANDMELCVDTS